MKIAVTGAHGTLGAPLCEALALNGHEVTPIDLVHNERILRVDVSEYRQVQTIPDVELVYHLAAEFGRKNGEDFTEQLWKTNVIGTKNMLRLQKERGFKMVFASSSEVYGERGDLRLSEDLPPTLLHNDYAMSKQVNENQIRNAGTETMILRFFNVYGPGEYFHRYRSVVALFLYSAIHQIPYTVYTGHFRPYQYIEDFINKVAWCPEKFTVGTFNIASQQKHATEYLHELVQELHPSPYTIEPMESDNVVSKLPDTRKQDALFGQARETPLEDGIVDTYDWMREVYG